MQVDSRIDWVVLAGGFGTRSADPTRPKILQQVGGSTLLTRHLDNISALGPSRVIFVVFHGAHQVRAEIEIQRVNYADLEILSVQDSGLGVLPALELGLSHCHSEKVGLILGDTYINADMQKLANIWRLSNRKLGVVGRITDHIFDSDSLLVDHELEVSAYSRKGESSENAGHLYGLTGLAFFDRTDLTLDYQSFNDAIPALLEAVGLPDCTFIPAQGLFQDTGTPTRLASVQQLDATFSIRPAGLAKTGAIFFDRDDTLVSDMPSGRFSVTAEELNEELVRCLVKASERGFSLHMVSNQPAIAKGWTTFEDTYAVNNQLATLLLAEGVRVTTMQFCPHHPESGFEGEVSGLKCECECRKPGSRMFHGAAKAASVDLEQSIMVGDSWADEQAAKALSMDFQGIVWGNRSARLSILEAWIDSH